VRKKVLKLKLHYAHHLLSAVTKSSQTMLKIFQVSVENAEQEKEHFCKKTILLSLVL
jgi:hypothetical protein